MEVFNPEEIKGAWVEVDSSMEFVCLECFKLVDINSIKGDNVAVLTRSEQQMKAGLFYRCFRCGRLT